MFLVDLGKWMDHVMDPKNRVKVSELESRKRFLDQTHETYGTYLWGADGTNIKHILLFLCD